MRNGDDSKAHGVKSIRVRPAPKKPEEPGGKNNPARAEFRRRGPAATTDALNAVGGLPGPRSTAGARGKSRDSRDRAGVQTVRGTSGSTGRGKTDDGRAGIADDDDGPDVRAEIELTSGNFAQSLRAVLMKECQSHINGPASAWAAPTADKAAAGASVSLRNRIQSAVKVSISNFPS